MYGVTLNQMNHKNKTEDYLFFVFQSVSRANKTNTVKMNAPPLLFK
jgi:hypothetical protein